MPNDLLLKFFNFYDMWDFTARRIYFWGARQPGFEKLKGYAYSDITLALCELLTCDLIETYMSTETGEKMFHAKR